MIPTGFVGAHLPRTPDGIQLAAKIVGCSALDIQTVIDIETEGCGFLPSGQPKILFERHHFSHLTDGLYDAAYPAISGTVAGGYIGGEGEYGRVAAAMALDAEAALKSTSWGLPQIMGSNYAQAGYATPDAMVADFCQSEDLQLAAMARFIVGAGIAPDLCREDFADFAERYNGPNYAANQYDKKLAADLARLRAMSGASPTAAWPAMRQRMAKAQAALNVDGYGPLEVDGWSGPATSAALRSFQSDSGLSQSGQLDAQTFIALFGQSP